jgi:hypothetical protein
MRIDPRFLPLLRAIPWRGHPPSLVNRLVDSLRHQPGIPFAGPAHGGADGHTIEFPIFMDPERQRLPAMQPNLETTR